MCPSCHLLLFLWPIPWHPGTEQVLFLRFVAGCLLDDNLEEEHEREESTCISESERVCCCVQVSTCCVSGRNVGRRLGDMNLSYIVVMWDSLS